jgi:hypothetical protein
MMVRSVDEATAAFVGLVLGAMPALAASLSPYDAYDQTAFLAYLNAPAAGGDLTRPPRLRISFGGRSYAVVMDTGSTGIVVSADKIPNIDRLQTQGPGRLTYSSSGRIMIGRWVVTPVTIMGRNGTRIAVAPISVLAVDRVECTDNARRCSPRASPRGISMLGIGFARRGDHQAQSGPAKNPFLNVATVNGAKAERLRRGYLVTRGGVFVGLTAANTQGDVAFVKLDRAGDDWAPTPVCISVNGVTPAACGSLLMDTGVDAMYLTVPESQAPDAVIRTTPMAARRHCSTARSSRSRFRPKRRRRRSTALRSVTAAIRWHRRGSISSAACGRPSSIPACISSTGSTTSTMPTAVSSASAGAAMPRRRSGR